MAFSDTKTSDSTITWITDCLLIKRLTSQDWSSKHNSITGNTERLVGRTTPAGRMTLQRARPCPECVPQSTWTWQWRCRGCVQERRWSRPCRELSDSAAPPPRLSLSASPGRHQSVTAITNNNNWEYNSVYTTLTADYSANYHASQSPCLHFFKTCPSSHRSTNPLGSLNTISPFTTLLTLLQNTYFSCASNFRKFRE